MTIVTTKRNMENEYNKRAGHWERQVKIVQEDDQYKSLVQPLGGQRF